MSLWQCLSCSSRAAILYPMVISHTSLDPCPMHILADSIVESLEHDRHVKVYIVYPSVLSIVRCSLQSSCTLLWHVLTSALFVEPGDYRLLEVMQNQTVSGAILSGCCDHMGQHMELFPLLSPGLFRHVSWALIMHFSAWGENWSICAKLASVPCGSPPTQSINSAQHHCTQHTCIQTCTQWKIHTKSLPQSHLGACAYSVHYSGRHALDHFLIVIMLFN